jgi:hypothetical protein
MVWWWCYRVEEVEKQCKEQDTRILELQDQVDILYKVGVPFLMSEYIKFYSVDQLFL